MNKKIKYSLIILGFLPLIIFLYNTPVFAAPQSDYIYNIYNKASGKCLNVNYGTDANGTNVTQYSKDGSLEQRFKLVYSSSRNSYKFYTMCSTNNRVLDILRTGGSASGSISSGCNVDIWADNDNDAQDFIITDRGNGYYSLHPRVNTSLALTSNGTGNGSGAGTSSSASGNVYVSIYTGSDNQLWSFRECTIRNYYYHANFNYTDQYVAGSAQHLPYIGYNYIKYTDVEPNNFLNDLRNSEVFLYFGHGGMNEDDTGYLSGDSFREIFARNTNTSAPVINSLSNGSLNNTKFVVYYSCYSGITDANYGNLVQVTFDKGAQCVLGFKGSLSDGVVADWNRLLWEKIHEQNESIVEGYRHADYWLPSIWGDDLAAGMNEYARFERGNYELHLYK